MDRAILSPWTLASHSQEPALSGQMPRQQRLASAPRPLLACIRGDSRQAGPLRRDAVPKLTVSTRSHSNSVLEWNRQVRAPGEACDAFFPPPHRAFDRGHCLTARCCAKCAALQYSEPLEDRGGGRSAANGAGANRNCTRLRLDLATLGFFRIGLRFQSRSELG